ncbi:MAG TPA: class I SAM-dependent methyltransferase [Candidatus Paceibacterota bacterium]
MKTTRNNFGKLVTAYSRYRRDYPKRAYEIIYKFRPEREARVLDLGCGTGIVTKHLAEYYNNVLGVDKEEVMIEVARQKATRSGYLLVVGRLVYSGSMVELIRRCIYLFLPTIFLLN